MKFIAKYKWLLLVGAILVSALVLSIVSALSPGRTVGGAALVGNIMKPIQTSLVSITDRVRTFFNSGRIIDELRAENARLRQHAADVEEQARLYQTTLEENERLRNFLEFKQRWRSFDSQPATVIAYDIDNYARTFTISRGSNHGVEPQMLALNEYGQLLGVVSEVGSKQSVLRVLVDTEFAIGAYLFRPGIDGVCRGRFENMKDGKLTMVGLSLDADVRSGDTVLTSDVSGLYPRDIVIGYVSELEYDKNGMTVTAIITPAANLTDVEQVFLLMAFESEE